VLPNKRLDDEPLLPNCDPLLPEPPITDDVGDCIGDEKPDMEGVPAPDPMPSAGGEL